MKLYEDKIEELEVQLAKRTKRKGTDSVRETSRRKADEVSRHSREKREDAKGLRQ